MKNFKEFVSESAEHLIKTANDLSKKADKENTIEAHTAAAEAHDKARRAHQKGVPGRSETSVHHYEKENEHRKKAFALKQAKGAPAPAKEKDARRLHWS